MSRVEIYRLDKEGQSSVIAEFSLQGDRAVGAGDESFINSLTNKGVLDKSATPPAKVFPSDGERFLKLLNTTFKSGYITASEVIGDLPKTE